MKKASEWLGELPNGYRELALREAAEQKIMDVECWSQAGAVDSIEWDDAKHGWGFWSDLCGYCQDAGPLPPLPEDTITTEELGEIVYEQADVGDDNMTATEVLKRRGEVYGRAPLIMEMAEREGKTYDELKQEIEESMSGMGFTKVESPFSEDAEIRKEHPVYEGFVKYFPDAIALVSHISWSGNQQHHPDKPLHWDKSKSADEPDALMRHMIDYSKSGDIEELGKVAWRAMAWLQRELEK